MVGLHINFVIIFSFLSDLAVAADFSETVRFQYKCLCYWKPERGGKGLKVERERNLACNQVIVAVNCSVYYVVEQKCLASLFFICTVSVCGFCIWECIGQTITRCPFHKLCCATWPRLGSQVLQPEIKPILSSNRFTFCQGCQRLAKCEVPPRPSQEIRRYEGRT